MHDAYEAIPIIEKLPLFIESIATCDDNLIIGTKQGHLLMYKIETTRNAAEKVKVDFARSSKYFSKKPILQLEAVPELQILICLSDSVISVHDLTVFNFRLLFTIEKTRGATLFALDQNITTSMTGEEVRTWRMCVVVRKRILLFYWKNRDFHDLMNDFSVPDVPRAIAWCADAICVGFKQEYCLIKLTGEQSGLISTTKSIETNVIRLKNDRLALCKDDKTVFLDLDGNPIHKDWITWSEPPINMEHDLPFLLAVVTNQVEVRTINPRLQIQSIKLTKPKFIRACNKGGRLFVASNDSVWCLILAPVSQQINQLVSHKYFELALNLVTLMDGDDEEKQKRKQIIQNMYAFHLFCNHKFEESMNIFLALKTDASHVIGLFPELLPQGFRNQLEYPDKLPDLDGSQLENGLIALISYLTQVRHSLIGDLNKTGIQNATALAEDSATNKSEIKLHQIIDTTLIKCYLRTNDALVASLLRLPDNNCHVEETERALKQFHKYNELIILYQCKKMHEKALEFLQRQARKDDSPLNGLEETVKYLQRLGKNNLPLIFRFAEWVISESPEDGLIIFAEDLHEVEMLPREEIYKYLMEQNENLVTPYLEFIITTWNDKSTLFHNALVLQYLKKILNLMSEIEDEKRNTEYNDDKTTQLKKLREKLMLFLEQSSFYEPEMLLVHFPFDNLFEERALLLGKLGRHEEALAIYALLLKNTEQADEYCLKNFDAEKNKEVYLILLKMYLCPPNVMLDIMTTCLENPEPNLPEALKLLQEHPTQIDPIKAIELLPNAISLKALQSFLEQVLQEKVAKMRNCQVLKGLMYAEQLQVHEQRINYESQKIIITEVNTCAECKKRINVSAFIQYPNGDIVHFYCREKYQSAVVR